MLSLDKATQQKENNTKSMAQESETNCSHIQDCHKNINPKPLI